MQSMNIFILTLVIAWLCAGLCHLHAFRLSSPQHRFIRSSYGTQPVSFHPSLAMVLSPSDHQSDALTLGKIGLWLDLRTSCLSTAETLQYLYRGVKETVSNSVELSDMLADVKDPISGLLYSSNSVFDVISECENIGIPGFSITETQKINEVSSAKKVGIMLKTSDSCIIEHCNAAFESISRPSLLFFDKTKPSSWSEVTPIIEFASSLTSLHKSTLAISVVDSLQVNDAILAAFRGRTSNSLIFSGSENSTDIRIGSFDLILVIEPDPVLWECCMMYMKEQ